MRWDASFDGRRCPACADLDGRIVEISGEFKARWKTAGGKSRQTTVERPPLHPNCRCVLVPWMDDWPDSDWDTEPPPLEPEAAI